jgi:hypothetical protein
VNITSRQRKSLIPLRSFDWRCSVYSRIHDDINREHDVCFLLPRRSIPRYSRLEPVSAKHQILPDVSDKAQEAELTAGDPVKSVIGVPRGFCSIEIGGSPTRLQPQLHTLRRAA